MDLVPEGAPLLMGGQSSDFRYPEIPWGVGVSTRPFFTDKSGELCSLPGVLAKAFPGEGQLPPLKDIPMRLVAGGCVC